MNSRIDLLQPYPFERMRTLFAGCTQPTELKPLNLGIGEPKLPTPPFLLEAHNRALSGLANYPETHGNVHLRHAISGWINRRFGASIDPENQVLPVSGSREGLFSIVQALIDPADSDAVVISPNPFYQIYEGASLVAGAKVHFVDLTEQNAYRYSLDTVPPEMLHKARIVIVCTPHNPTGAALSLDDWRALFAKSDAYDFVIVSDEPYSEIYFGDAPIGALEAATKLGRSDFRNIIAFNSLSKRSNMPGLRSGFAAGDAEIIQKYLQFRMYHGAAPSQVVQLVSTEAWSDEAHVEVNRAYYQALFARCAPELQLNANIPDGGFFMWAKVPPTKGPGTADENFARRLFVEQNLTVVPGSYLGRDAGQGNPGEGIIRIAMVYDEPTTREAIRRINAASSR